MLECELVPARQRNSRWLMVVLHGLGDSMEGYRWLPEAMGSTELNYLLVNAPDQYYGGYSWYDFAGDKGVGIQRSRKLLFDLLDAQVKAGFATDQTVLFGFSQGCLMTLDVGVRYPHRFAGLVGISGYVFEPEKVSQELTPIALQQRLLVTHGTQDPLIPFAEVKGQITLLKASGLNIDWREFEKAHTIAGESELSVIRDFVQTCFSSE